MQTIIEISICTAKASLYVQLDGPTRFGEWSRKLSNFGQSLDGCPKIYYLELLRDS
jgi:hypothetical protein